MITFGGDNHSDTACDFGSYIGGWSGASCDFPGRWLDAVPPWIESGFSKSWRLVERIAVRKARMSNVAGHAFSAPIPVQLHTSSWWASGDVSDFNATRKSIDIDRPGPERWSIGCGKLVDVITEVYLQLVAGLEVSVLEVKHQQLCSIRCCRRIERRRWSWSNDEWHTQNLNRTSVV